MVLLNVLSGAPSVRDVGLPACMTCSSTRKAAAFEDDITTSRPGDLPTPADGTIEMKTMRLAALRLSQRKCFSLLLPYYKNSFLDVGKNIVKWLGQCFLPELAN